MFEELSERLEATFARPRGRGVLSEADIKEGLREVSLTFTREES